MNRYAVVIRLLLWLLVSLTAAGCGRPRFEYGRFDLQEGDLLFQDADHGPLCDAIETVTQGYEGANLSHVGIVGKDPESGLVVLEAVSSGVKITPVETFLHRSVDAAGNPKVIVGRLKKPYRHLIPSAIKEARALVGKPYDKLFEAGNDSYCCSELVYEAFLRANGGIALFELKPMTFKDRQTGETLTAWQEYFSKLGVPIPEGQPGINPGGISRSQVLNIIYAYGTPSYSHKKARELETDKRRFNCETSKDYRTFYTYQQEKMR